MIVGLLPPTKAPPVSATPEDHVFAADLATRTGEALLGVREQLIEGKLEHSEMKDAGDAAAQALIAEALDASRPDDAVLSEEASDDKTRLGATRTWIIDPLDGTREYAEPPRTDWAVHIALAIDGVPTVGAVALPAQNLTLATGDNAPVLPPAHDGPPRVIVSRTRRPPAAVSLAEKLEAEYLEMGSAGAKAMAVVLGEADIYAHSGGQYEWDNCAPAAVALAAGLHCSRIDGSPLVYNNEDPYLPDLLICRMEWADRCLEILNS